MLEDFYKIISSEEKSKQAAEALNALVMATNAEEEPKDKIKIMCVYAEGVNIYNLVLERKNDDGTIQFFIIEDIDRSRNYTVEDFEDAPLLSPKNYYVYDFFQNYCKRKYHKTIEQLETVNDSNLQKKIDTLEKRIAKLEEYAEALDMVAELINDIFPE